MAVTDAKAPENLFRWIAFLILLFGIGIHLIGLNKGIWQDECYSLYAYVNDNEIFQNFQPDAYPLYLLLLGAWSIPGTSEAWLRLLNVLLSAGMVLVLLLWLKTFSRTGSLLAGLLVTSLPILSRYSQELRAYALLLLATTLSFYFAARIQSDPKKWSWYLMLAGSLSLAAVTHEIGVLLIFSLLAYLVPTLIQFRRADQWLKLSAVIVVPALIYLSIFLLTARSVKVPVFWMAPIDLNSFQSTMHYVAGAPALFWLPNKLVEVNPWLAQGLRWIILTGFVLITIAPLVWGDWRRNWNLLAASVVFFGLVIIVSIFIVPIFWYRTVLPGLIPLIAFIALQAASIPVRSLKFAIISSVCVCCALYISGWIAIEARVPNEPWKQVTQIIESEYEPGDWLVLYPWYIECPIRYYFPELPAEGIISIKQGTDPELINQALATDSAKSTTPAKIFLVVRKDSTYAADHLTYDALVAQLQASAAQASPPEEHGIVLLTRYSLP
jgi:hypothetical protein